MHATSLFCVYLTLIGKDGFVFADATESALKKGSLSADVIDKAVGRSIAVRMAAGAFDPVATQQYTKLGPEWVNATAHWNANLDAASQGIVLLVNANNTLPLKAGGRLAIVGKFKLFQYFAFL